MSTKPRTLRDIKHKECRWVIGDEDGIDTLFCAEPTKDGSSYCGPHHLIVYDPNAKSYNEAEVEKTILLLERMAPIDWNFIVLAEIDGWLKYQLVKYLSERHE